MHGVVGFQSVHDDAHPCQRGSGIGTCHGGCTVHEVEMLQGVSQFRQPVIYGNDKVLLCLRIRHVIRIYRVCHGKVGVDALNGQLIQFEQGQQSLGTVLRRIAPEADASHAGVQLDVAANRLVGETLQLSGIFQRQHALNDVVPCQFRCELRRRIAQNEDLSIGAKLPDRKGFFQIGNRKPADSQFPELLADRSVAVSIGVRLDYRHKLRLCRQTVLHGLYIMRQCVQVDLCPRTIAFLLFLFHDPSRSFSGYGSAAVIRQAGVQAGRVKAAV